MQAQSHRILSGLTILVMIALVAAGWLLVAQPQLAAASTANDQIASVNTQVATTQTTINQLRAEQAKLPDLKAQLAALRSSIPTDADVSQYIDTLNALAGASGVTLTSIKVSPAAAYVAPVIVPPVTASTSTPAPASTSAPATPATPVTPTAWSPTVDSTITGINFVSIPVNVTVSGSQDQTLAFLKGLQTGTRLFLVNAINNTVASDGNGVTASIDGFIYVLLDPAATAAATKTAPAAGVTVDPTATPNPSGSATPTPTQSSTPTKKP
jgi:Tfp pilus assembly protein PilO